MSDGTEETYCAVSACVDCVFLLANGDVPEERPDLPDIIASRWAGFWLALGCSEDCCERTEDGDSPAPWFSWSSCDVCGSRLSGDREHVTPFPIAT